MCFRDTVSYLFDVAPPGHTVDKGVYHVQTISKPDPEHYPFLTGRCGWGARYGYSFQLSHTTCVHKV